MAMLQQTALPLTSLGDSTRRRELDQNFGRATVSERPSRGLMENFKARRVGKGGGDGQGFGAVCDSSSSSSRPTCHSHLGANGPEADSSEADTATKVLRKHPGPW